MFTIKPLKKPAGKPAPAKAHNAFAAAMEDDNKPAASSQGHALQSKVPLLVAEMSKQSHKKMLDETSKYITEDPTIYDYDNHYDDISTKRQEIAEQKKEKKESRYIENIIKHAEKRKIERDIITEKLAEKELIREGLNKNADKYVTKGYLKMMEKNKQFLEEDAAKEAYNEAHAANTENNMAGLYQNLFKDDSFMGGRRPDLDKMMKEAKTEPAKPVVNAQPQEKPQAAPMVEEKAPAQNIPQPEKAVERKREEINKEEASHKRHSPERTAPREERRKRSESRSRSREKSPLRQPTPKEEAKPEIKELSKEDKAKLAKERYMQRKLGQNVATNQENA